MRTEHFYMWEWLSGTISNSRPVAANNSAFLGQAMFAYQVLDLLLWIFEWPQHQQLLNIPRSAPPVDMPLALRRILSSIED
jgi:hypothetical protein